MKSYYEESTSRKMKYTTLYCVIICGLIFSYKLSGQVNSRVKLIDLTSGLTSSEKTMKLSEIAAKVEYIFLETTNECLMDDIKKISIDDSLVFISDSKQLLIFNSSGKFIANVGGIGRGPGQYVKVLDFSIDILKDRIFVLDRYLQKVICYDYNGNYQYDFRFRTPYPSSIEVINNTGLIITYATPLFIDNGNYCFALYSFDGKFIRNSFNRQNEAAQQAMAEAGQHRLNYYCDSLTFWEIHLNTIYRVTNGGDLFPRYTIDYKGYNNVKNRGSLEKDNLFFAYFIEFEKYLFFIKGIRNNELKHIIYDKKKDEAINFCLKTEDFRLAYETAFINDIDGGFPFLPVDALKDGRLYCTFYPYEFKQLLKNYPHKSIDITNIEQKNDFYKKIENSNVLDNAVIMLVTEKK
ncbi:6-bladed beta-propeller [Maribellus maritimus]|uniref:6-bladed beta-propeller n=1 Tax=Maribellus maritimus TaxID=2870838 RepID=UPI001EEB96DE|nr:6-bladed beta-propeller [Maribellus maritimus]MCG6191002.1 6-bladed beta-propeller [Maribellus maritimus]